MVRLALLSKHIVITDNTNNSNPSYPQSGLILIEDSHISDVIIQNDPGEYELLKENYADWNIIDYSDLYISPGLIDLNVRTEWEDLSSLTQQAVLSGVTTVVVEPGYYCNQESHGNLHCDVFKVQIMTDALHAEVDPSFPTVLKAYLFPPAPNVKSVCNLQHTLSMANRYKLPFFIDATLPDPRMLYMASPLRLEEVPDRRVAEKNSFSYFASAFSQEGKESGEEEDDPDDDPFPIRTGSLPNDSEAIDENELHSHNFGKPPLALNEFPQIKKIKNFKNEATLSQLSNIYDNLDTRIKQTQLNHEDLFHAETSTYSYSRGANYESLKKTTSGSKLPGLAELRSNSSEVPKQINHHLLVPNSTEARAASPSPNGIAARLGMRGKTLNLVPINTCKTPTSTPQSDYLHHLANIPVDWETGGVKKVLELLDTNSQVHFCGLSSAYALNLIRQAKFKHPKITSEIIAVNLCFTSLCVEQGNTRFKNNPPVRNSSNNTLLWELVKMKGIDVICSGHASIHPDMKLTENFQTALNGISSIGCCLQAVWFILNKPVLSKQQMEHYIVRLAKWMSLHPAEVLKVGNLRGSIKKGKFADLVVWDPWERYKLGNEYKYSRTSPFLGVDLMGKIKQVYFKGKAKIVG